MVKIPSNIEVSGFNFPIIQFYENKDRAVFLGGYDMILPYFTIEFPGSRFVYLFWSCTIWDNAIFFAAKCQRTSKNTNWSTSDQGIIVALDISNQADLLQRVGL